MRRDKTRQDKTSQDKIRQGGRPNTRDERAVVTGGVGRSGKDAATHEVAHADDESPLAPVSLPDAPMLLQDASVPDGVASLFPVAASPLGAMEPGFFVRSIFGCIRAAGPGTLPSRWHARFM